MNPTAEVSAPTAPRQGSLTPAELLVLALLLAGVAVGAVMSAKLLQKRVLASNAVTATLSLQEQRSTAPPTRPV